LKKNEKNPVRFDNAGRGGEELKWGEEREGRVSF
jgi:hypothetical protein